MKAKTIHSIVIISIFSFMLTTCDMFGTINATVSGLKFSMQVNNRTAGRATIGSTDTVELYLERFRYEHDGFDLDADGFSDGGYIIIVSNVDTDDDGYYFDNADWYDASIREWQARTKPFSGAHSSFNILITKMRINGDVYDFPEYGLLTFGKSQYSGVTSYYPDNFSGIFMPGPNAYKMPNPKPNPEGPMGLDRSDHESTASRLETILTVEPDIVDNCFDLITRQPLQTESPGNPGYDSAKDPYTYIKVQAIVHE